MTRPIENILLLASDKLRDWAERLAARRYRKNPPVPEERTIERAMYDSDLHLTDEYFRRKKLGECPWIGLIGKDYDPEEVRGSSSVGAE